MRLQPQNKNFDKRLVKSPKLYFLEVGLMAWLLGIRDTNTLDTHASRAALFETFVVSELVKHRFNQGEASDLYFWRDSTGNEVDVVFETPNGLQAIEIKSVSTFAPDWI
jgi:predicted AAA+ superfamily ATPase